MIAKTRLWVLITGILCVLVVLYGVFAGLIPQLSGAAQTNAESENTELIIETQQLQLQRLETAADDSSELAGQLAELEFAIPRTPDWANFLRELQDIQGSSGALVSEIAVQPSILPGGEASAAPPVTDAPADADSAGSGAADPDSAMDPATGEAAAPTAQTTNLTEIPITITITGEAAQVVEFVRQLQTGDRLFFAVSVEMDGAGEAATAMVNGSIYVAP